MFAPEAFSAFGDVMTPRRSGVAATDAVTLHESRFDIVEVTAFRGHGDAVRAQLSGEILPIAPASWLILSTLRPAGVLARELRDKLEGLAAVIDQSSGYAALRLRGMQARAVLAKGCRIDLHTSSFGPRRAARTIIAQIPAIVYQVDDIPTFDLIAPSTLARSFAEHLIAAAAEFGCDIVAAQ